jgi:hypothetical protein
VGWGTVPDLQIGPRVDLVEFDPIGAVPALRAANLALKFGLELAAFASAALLAVGHSLLAAIFAAAVIANAVMLTAFDQWDGRRPTHTTHHDRPCRRGSAVSWACDYVSLI